MSTPPPSMHEIPPEIFQRIFSFLAHHKRTISLASLACRSWHNELKKILFRHLRVSVGTKKHTWKKFQGLVHSSNGIGDCIRWLGLFNVRENNPPEPEVLVDLLKALRRLDALELHGCWFRTFPTSLFDTPRLDHHLKSLTIVERDVKRSTYHLDLGMHLAVALLFQSIGDLDIRTSAMAWNMTLEGVSLPPIPRDCVRAHTVHLGRDSNPAIRDVFSRILDRTALKAVHIDMRFPDIELSMAFARTVRAPSLILDITPPVAPVGLKSILDELDVTDHDFLREVHIRFDDWHLRKYNIPETLRSLCTFFSRLPASVYHIVIIMKLPDGYPEDVEQYSLDTEEFSSDDERDSDAEQRDSDLENDSDAEHDGSDAEEDPLSAWREGLLSAWKEFDSCLARNTHLSDVEFSFSRSQVVDVAGDKHNVQSPISEAEKASLRNMVPEVVGRNILRFSSRPLLYS
ncbi:hypothetical protein K474DRAFT_171996 [Panus rudis PR-1116 ss-1]|nr:hypothetical protein K474DRAFT_171996 [Panus rudis PR-1116 ss-1]